MLSAERLRELLHYDAATGAFTRLISRGLGKAGTKAGCLSLRGRNRKLRRFIGVDRKYYAASRLAWLYVTGKWPKEQIDHVNGISSDDRFENLREATQGQNQANKERYRSNKSGLKGVHFRADSRQFRAMIQVNGRRISLGNFKTAHAAHVAFAEASSRLHGEFARP